MKTDDSIVTTLLGARVEVTTRSGWNPPPNPELRGGYSTDLRQTDNEPLTGIIRTIALSGDFGDFVFHIETDDGRLIVKTSTASCLRVVR